MVTTTDRQRMRVELVAQGYSWEYIDEWQPKTTLYRHAPGLDINGEVVFPVGTSITGVPGNPDYVLRKARLGMFPYLPGDNCECRWCTIRNAHAEPVTEEGRGLHRRGVRDLSGMRGRCLRSNKVRSIIQVARSHEGARSIRVAVTIDRGYSRLPYRLIAGVDETCKE